jgi:hemerythrin-like domain-containing protein
MAHNIFQTLHAEHDVLRSLTELALKTTGNSGRRELIWYRLKMALTLHAEAEERSLYRALQRHPSTEELATHSIVEHDAIEELIHQLDHIGFDQPAWLSTLERLAEVSEHHLAEEERELFPVAGRVLSATEKEDCAKSYLDHYNAQTRLVANAMRRTTRTGVDGRTLESRPLDELEELANERDIDAQELNRSQLISALRNAPSADLH